MAQLGPGLWKTYFHAGFKKRIKLHPVRIYYDTSIFDKITYDVKATPSEKISEIGGVLGLYNGFSVITLVEILYFLFRAFLIIIQAIDRRFCISQTMKNWIQLRWEALRQTLQNMTKTDKKKGKKTGKEEDRTDTKEEEPIASTSKAYRDEINVVDIE